MKTLKSILCVGVFVFGSTLPAFAQVVLPEFEVYAMNYKYLDAVDVKESSEKVALLERYAAAFDPRYSQYYEDEYDTYFISFIIPEGKVLAAYDKDGNLLRTAERFKDVALPKAVREAVAKRFPNWVITKDLYMVTHHSKKGTNKRYKLLLKNGEYRQRVKMNDKGEFL